MSMTDIADSNLLSDRGYVTKEILAFTEKHGATVVISPKSNAKQPLAVDYFLSKERHLVECFSGRSNGFAALLQGMINLISLFSLFVYMAAVMIWLL